MKVSDDGNFHNNCQKFVARRSGGTRTTILFSTFVLVALSKDLKELELSFTEFISCVKALDNETTKNLAETTPKAANPRNKS